MNVEGSNLYLDSFFNFSRNALWGFTTFGCRLLIKNNDYHRQMLTEICMIIPEFLWIRNPFFLNVSRMTFRMRKKNRENLSPQY